jgi:hypothetical protein
VLNFSKNKKDLIFYNPVENTFHFTQLQPLPNKRLMLRLYMYVFLPQKVLAGLTQTTVSYARLATRTIAVFAEEW